MSRGASLLVVLVTACAAPSPAPSPAPKVRAGVYRYDVEVGDGVLRIAATLPPSAEDVELVPDAPYLDILSKRPARCTDGCTIRYEVDLDRAVDDAGGRLGTARTHGLYILSPAYWLLRPSKNAIIERFEVRVRARGDWRFATGLPRRGDAWGGRALFLDYASMSVFGRIDTERAGAVTVVRPAGAFGDRWPMIRRWIDRNVTAVTSYYGRFPEVGALLVVLPAYGDTVEGGMTLGYVGAAIRITVGTEVTEPELAADWRLPHELVHLALPNVGRDHAWLEEGMATYVEPVARVWAGQLDPDRFWLDLAHGLPNGLGAPHGLQRSRTWGATYWGGALFYFLADLELLRRSDGHRGLEVALRGILRDAGGVRGAARPYDVLSLGDRATGESVLLPLYARLGYGEVDVDVDDLLHRLGVRVSASGVRYDDDAPEAPLRRALMSPR